MPFGTNDDAWFLLGLVLSKKQDYKGASEAYRHAAKVNPNHPNAWLNLADAYRKAFGPATCNHA